MLAIKKIIFKVVIVESMVINMAERMRVFFRNSSRTIFDKPTFTPSITREEIGGIDRSHLLAICELPMGRP